MNILQQHIGERFAAYHADCISFMQSMPDTSVDLSVYSPPFGDLFVYSESAADMGNSASDEEFQRHYGFLAEELLRITKPGRLVAVHCSDLPARKWKDGFIGLRDFSGQLVDAHQSAGWIYHSRVTVWKDPVVEMQRTKALGLLYKQLKKDSTMSRMGMPDYVLLFRAPGINENPVEHDEHEFPVAKWQQWASPVWMDIDQTDVLNVRAAKDEKDEKHLCPLQLDLIERVVRMYSNAGDVVFSPFMGIGSEGYVSVKCGRKFIGTELKESYWRQACRYITEADAEANTPDLFSIARSA